MCCYKRQTATITTLLRLHLILLWAQKAAGIILIRPEVPEIYQRATITCYSVEQTRTWFHKEARLSICNNQGCLPNEISQSGYKFTGENDKAEVTISSLNRTRDKGLWTCTAGVSQSISVDVYSFPSGLSFTQGGDTEVDLAESQTILQCQTDECTYPAPNISWYFKDTTPSAPRTFYKDTGTRVTGGSCTSPEELYTSRLVLPLYTIWQDNIDKNVTLSCGIEYSNVSRNVYSQESKQIRYAVAVASVSLSVSASRILFYQGFSQLLTCISSPSRPIPTIIWYLGSRQLTSNITLTNTTGVTGLYNLTSHISLTLAKDDNKQEIYCNASIYSQQIAASSSRSIVDVWYQPEKPNVNEYGGAQGEFPWLENTTGVLHCNSSDYGNPKSNITWPMGRGVMNQVGNLVIADLLPSDHGREISCQLSNQFTIDKSMPVYSQPVHLKVEYYPIINFNVSSPLKVNETQFVSVWCAAHGNPNPELAIWKDQTDGDTLRFDNISRNNAGAYMCEAIANSTRNGILKRQKQLDIIVQYAPDMKIMLISSSQQNTSAVFVCEAQGVPLENTFSPWTHVFGDVEISTELQGKTNSTHSILTIDILVLEDMGTYKCAAKNGIMGTNKEFVQIGARDIHVTGTPNILGQNCVFAREVGLSHNISIPFYSDPAIETFIIEKNDTVMMNTSRTVTYLLNGAVSYKFYGKTVKLEAHTVHVSFQNLTQEDLANYKLILKNSLGSTEFIFHVNASGPPKMVDRFYFNRFIHDRIELHFDSGFNGGPDQTFVIEYKSSTESAWKNTGIQIQEAEIQYRLPNGTFLVNVTKPSPGSYEYRIYSWNIKGKSPFSESITVVIPSENNGKHGQDSLPVAAIAGGIGAAIFIIAVIAIILFIWKRRSHIKKTSEGTPLELNGRSEDINKSESELVDNPMYETSGPRFGPSNSKGTTVAEYAAVVKSKNKGALVADASNLYAQVDRSKIDVKKGDMYENFYLGGKSTNADSKYENSKRTRTESSDRNVYENPGTVASISPQVNKDGLLYADLMLGPPTTRNGRVVIRGTANRTEYAEIAYGKRGEPLPDSDEEKVDGHEEIKINE